jgi:hypothetical protein
MNGYGSHRNATIAALMAIQMMIIVWLMMNFGVPKNRAKRSASTPKRSPPNGRW